jgi:DNA primase
MPRISEESIRKVAESNDIVDVIGSYIQIKRAGVNFKALCPFHREKTPSFTVNPSRQSFRCFGCGAGGGVIRFVMDYEQVPFAEAVRRLARRSGTVLVEESGQAEEDGQRQQRARLLSLHHQVADWFHAELLRAPAAEVARTYLRERGLHKEIAVRWRLGYAPASPGACLTFARQQGFTETEILASGLCGRSEERGEIYDRFRGRIMIPIHNDYGEVVGFSGRILDPEMSPAKYVNSPETPIFQKGRLLFGLHQSKRSIMEKDAAIVCEGQFDLITAFEAGVTNVIAPQGTAFTPHQAAMVKRFASTAILCFDSDAAGQKAIDRSLPALLAQEVAVKVLTLPAGDDPDTLIRREGGEAFAERARQARDILTFQLDKADAAGALQTPEGIARTARSIAPLVRMFPDLVQRDAAVNQIAQRLRVAPARVADAVRRARSPSDPSLHSGEEDTAPAPAPVLPEVCAFLCRIGLGSLPARQWLQEHARPDWTSLGEAWEPFRLVLEGDFDPSVPASVGAFLATCSPRCQQALAALDEDRHLPADPVASAQATWQGFLRQNILRQRDEIKARLLQPNLPPDVILQVHKELLDLQKALQEVPPPPATTSTDRATA